MSNYSSFVYPNYIVDSLSVISSLPASQYQNAILLNQLRALTNPTSDQIAQINSLTATLAPYEISTDQWNTLSQAIVNMETLILKLVNFQDMGTWSSGVTYKLWNSVQYLGQTFISKQDGNLGNTPVGGSSDIFWSLSAQKGQKGDTGAVGQQGSPGLGLTFTGDYNAGTTYVLGNAVRYTDNNIYYCISTSTGNLPTNTSFWNIFLSNTGIAIQSTAPSSPYTSMIWVDTSTSQNLMKYWDASTWIAISTYNASQISIADAGNILTATNTEDAIQELANNSIYQTAGGTATAITLTTAPLINNYSKTFIASANNNGSATTINTKPLYKPNTTTVPTLIAGKAYTVWYSTSNSCFFIKASAEGNTVAGHVLAGDTFSNDTDNGIVGTMPDLRSSTQDQGTSIGSGGNFTTGWSIVSDTGDPNNRVNITLPNTHTGYHDGTTNEKIQVWGIAPNLVKAGQPIGAPNSSLVGTFTSDANAVASQILSGLYAYVNGVKLTGTMPIGGNQEYTGYQRASTTYAVSPRLHMYIPHGAYLTDRTDGLSGVNNTTGIFADDPNFIPANILSGTSIFGVTGTAVQDPITSFSSGSTVCIFTDTREVVTQSTTYVKMKEFRANRSGTIQVTFNLRSDPAYATYAQYARVYINNVVVGLERTNNTTNYVAFTESFIVNNGDLIEIYGYRAGGQCEIGTVQMWVGNTLPYVAITV